jgi:hypothetical protein
MAEQPIQLTIIFQSDIKDVDIIDRKVNYALDDLRRIGIESGSRIFKKQIDEGEKGISGPDPTMVNALHIAVLPLAIPKVIEFLKSNIDEMGPSKQTSIKLKTQSGVEVEITARISTEELTAIAKQLASPGKPVSSRKTP